MAADIRRLQPDDWSALRAIRLQALREVPEVYGTTLDQEIDRPDEFWRDRLTDPANPIFCGFQAGTAVALAGLRDGAGGNVRHRGFIWGVFVAGPWRGRGLGEAVMRALLDHADARAELDFTELNVRADNTSAARLYARLGFRAVGTIPRALKHAGRYGDELMMVRDRPG
jgi:ribosomal protein S18 acetylase RimI-like enzyme